MTEHPPGWHPDPRGRHEHRYWDGTKWTDHVADGGVTGQDSFDAETVEIAAPIGPSMVNLPAIDPSLLQRPSEPVAATPPPEPVAVPTPTPPSTVPPPDPTPAPAPAPASETPVSHREQKGPEDALESVSDAFDNAAASLAHKPGSLAALLTVAAPGMGHVYLGGDGARRTKAFILLGATVAAVVFSCFISFPIGLLIYLAALAFAFVDLKDDLAPMQQTRASSGPLGMFSDLGAGLSWRLVVAGGALLAISLLLPWYRQAVAGVSVTVSGFDVLKLIDLILLVIGAGSAVLGVLNLNQGTAQRPVSGQLATIVAAAGALAFVLVVFRLLIVPDGGLEFGIERSFGLLLAFAASVLLAGGAAGAATSKS